MNARSIVHATIDEVRLEAAPIRAEWILEGAPQARCMEISRSPDGASCTAVWDCTAGRFDWHFTSDETVHILEGEVEVTDGQGRRTLRPGDVAFFPAGSTSTWRVGEYVKKLAFLRDPVPGPVLRFVNLVRRVKNKLRGQPVVGAPAFG